MIALGAEPTATRSDGRPFYTLPVIEDDDRHPGVISDSSTIADYIERNYPSPSVFPTGTRALQAAFIAFLSSSLGPALRPLVIPAVNNILDKRGQEYFRRTREAQFGTTLENVLPLGSEKREKQWLEVAGVLDRVSSWMEGSEGDWLGGHSPVYADFVLASLLLWVIKGGVPDGWSRIKGWNDGRWAKLVDNCAAFLK